MLDTTSAKLLWVVSHLDKTSYNIKISYFTTFLLLNITIEHYNIVITTYWIWSSYNYKDQPLYGTTILQKYNLNSYSTFCVHWSIFLNNDLCRYIMCPSLYYIVSESQENFSVPWQVDNIWRNTVQGHYDALIQIFCFVHERWTRVLFLTPHDGWAIAWG